MITVYHLNESRSQRILWLLEEMDAPYEIVRFERDATRRAPPELAKVHPLGKAPVIRDDDLVLAESGAIVEYLGERHGGGRLAPRPDTAAHAHYLHWLHFAEGSAMLPMLLDHFEKAGMCGPVGTSQIAVMARSEMDRLFKALDGILAKQEWMAGPRFTAADCMMGWYIEMIELRGEIAPYPALQRYVAKLAARPARQRARLRAQKAR